MKKLSVVLALGLMVPTIASAEPISVKVDSSSGGFKVAAPAKTGWFAIDLGTVTMPSAGSAGIFMVDGLKHGSDYTVSLAIAGMKGWDALRVEILDPVGGDDKWDPVDQPAYVPAGYSTSNKFDGFSFAQDSAIKRSALFAGGAGSVTADEKTHSGDVLMFTGLGTTTASFTFGLRDRLGSRSFLVRLSAIGADPVPNPEPASMLLIGTGLAGLVAARRRRSVA